MSESVDALYPLHCNFVWYLEVYIAIYISYNTDSELKNKRGPERENKDINQLILTRDGKTAGPGTSAEYEEKD
jgi:hypothetical protein